MSWQVYDLTRRPRVVIMVSKLDHCLADLLFRWRMNELRMDIAAIVSNHPDLLPWRGNTRSPSTTCRHAADQARAGSPAAAAGRGQRRGPGGAGALQVLSPDATARLAGRAINIHHSFLPGFRGAPLSPGLRTRRQTDRGHRALRDRGSGRRPHHRTDGGPRGPQLRPAQLLAAGRDMECVARPCGCISNAASSSTTTGRWCVAGGGKRGRRRPLARPSGMTPAPMASDPTAPLTGAGLRTRRRLAAHAAGADGLLAAGARAEPSRHNPWRRRTSPRTYGRCHSFVRLEHEGGMAQRDIGRGPLRIHARDGELPQPRCEIRVR